MGSACSVSEFGEELARGHERMMTLDQLALLNLLDAPLATQRRAHCATGRAKDDHRARGDLALQIPELRTGSFFPSLLERRRRADQVLCAAS